MPKLREPRDVVYASLLVLCFESCNRTGGGGGEKGGGGLRVCLLCVTRCYRRRRNIILYCSAWTQ